jgi:hypothetical protein
VGQEICTICCGEKREQTIDCPLDCPYLIEAHRREQRPILDPGTFPNADVRVTETFLREHEELLLYISASLLEAALTTPGAVDSDIREALAALIKTYRTLESGLIYETRPENMIAATLQGKVQQAVTELRKAMAEKTGLPAIRDLDILGVLVFLQRLELQNSNDRRRGRAFVQFLRAHFPATRTAPQPAPAAPLIQQG